MADFTFDIVSDFDKAEVNNVFDQANREISNRYDFKGTSTALEWLGSDKDGFKITGDSEFQIDAVIDIIRKKLASRNLSQKMLDATKEVNISNLKATKDIPFVRGLDQQKAKEVQKIIKSNLPKVKTSVIGESIRVSSNKKDELQAVITLLQSSDLSYPLNFNNFR